MKYRYFEKEGAVFRMLPGHAAPTEIMGKSGWEPYKGDGLHVYHSASEISAAEAGVAAAEAETAEA